MSTVSWTVIFGNARSVEIEIGPGRGETLLAAAAARPATNFFGIERIAAAATSIAETATARGIRNLRIVAGDARCILEQLVPDASVAAYHIYFPDPWPKTRHRLRRLATTDFGAILHRTLVPGGAVHVLSDLRPLVDSFVTHLTRAGLIHHNTATAPSARPITRFERKYATTTGTFYARLESP